MELAATKGIRDEILLKKQYSEGSSVKVSIDDFSMSVLGLKKFMIYSTNWKINDFGNRDNEVIFLRY